MGGLYIAGPVIGWVLTGVVFAALYLGRKSLSAVPAAVWLWMGGMLAMLVILWIGHANFALGAGQTIKSSIGWAKGWALIALFPLAVRCWISGCGRSRVRCAGWGCGR